MKPSSIVTAGLPDVPAAAAAAAVAAAAESLPAVVAVGVDTLGRHESSKAALKVHGRSKCESMRRVGIVVRDMS